MRAILLSVVTLAGCVTNPAQDPIIVTQKVEVPVEVKCVISYPKEPSETITSLPAGSSPYAKLTMALKELEGQRQYSKELRAVLGKCAEDKSIDVTSGDK